MADSDSTTMRRVYGRGYFDGIKKAEAMNAAKIQELENNLTGIARKVLGAVPIAEAWESKRIHAELARLGINIERTALDGCMASLLRSGMVREPQAGRFTRVSAKPKLTQVVATPMETEKVMQSKTQDVAPADKKLEPLDKLADIAASIRAFSKAADDLAKKIEEVSLEVLGHNEKIYADNAKLRQLQELLKSIS